MFYLTQNIANVSVENRLVLQYIFWHVLYVTHFFYKLHFYTCELRISSKIFTTSSAHNYSVNVTVVFRYHLTMNLINLRKHYNI